MLPQHKKPVVSVDRASKLFSGIVAFEDVSFNLNLGQIMVVAGPNGGGKTTLLRSIVGMLTPDNPSSIRVLGEIPSARLDIRRNIAYVPDEDDLLNQLTGAEYVEFSASAFRLIASDVLSVAYELAQELELNTGDMSKKLIGNYSHGMRKKLQLVAALSVKPKLLVIDEPTNGLDPTAVILLKHILKRQDQSAVLVASHHLAFAQDIADQVLLLRQKPLQNGEIGAVLESNNAEKLEEVYERRVLEAI